MNEIRKKLLISVILIIIYDLVCYFTNSIITKNALETWLNIITISLSFVASIYELILVFNTKIDLNKHKSNIRDNKLTEEDRKQLIYLFKASVFFVAQI